MERIELPYVTMWKEEGILYAIYAKDAVVDREAAVQIVEARLKISGKKSYPCIIDIREVKSFTKESREYLALEGAEGIIACGLITGNPFTRTLAHIFLTVNRPKVPTLLFGDIESAKKWVSKFVKE